MTRTKTLFRSVTRVELQEDKKIFFIDNFPLKAKVRGLRSPFYLEISKKKSLLYFARKVELWKISNILNNPVYM